jgi:hypothetical protein
MKDGSVFEKLYMDEVKRFWDVLPWDVSPVEPSHETLLAAVLLRAHPFGNWRWREFTATEVLDMLYQRKLRAANRCDGDDDTADDLEFIAAS